MTMKKIILASAALILICQFGLAEPHTWTFKSGVTFPGEFVSATTNSVIVELEGRNFSLAVTNLVDDDVAYVQKIVVGRRQFALLIAMQQADYRKRKGEEYDHAVMLSTNQPIVITAVLDDNSNAGIPLCRVKGLSENILIKDLPGDGIVFLNQQNKLRSDINDLADKIEQDTETAQLSSAVEPLVSEMNDPGFVWTQNNLKWLQVHNEKKALEKMQAALSGYIVVAFPSAETFGGYRVWYCAQ